ncbi:SDR family NAD(P)-dependent oxidoreductase [Ahrensia sp. R2A130]|uniref:SDR family NAD(P)-dependent oxidoreductase n=1 Tax=Ahrensia sp. R2A130 TaxID=744979 RepID=UPI0001E0C35C|nr:3-oxoacyl-[acyl-carrier-protein] reductase 1 [Ahrensia sp. R2A130]
MPITETAFAGKTVVITGAGRGIGHAVAGAFSQAGARVLAHSGRAGTAGLLDGLCADCFEADFTQSEDVQAFIDWTLGQTEQVDVLINNAGTMMGRFPADSLSDDDYDALVALNQTAVVKVTRGLIPALRKSDAGAIINTVSISALTGGSPGSSIYSATKAFVGTYTRALARELAPDGIRANAVSPGTIETDFHERYSSAEKLAATAKAVPLQRLGTPEDCAPAYLFLAHPKLSGYITGQTIEINGGQLIV